MKETLFRLWLMRIYMEHKDEAQSLGFQTYDVDTYFRIYKWWLKREYRYQQQNA